MPRSVKGYKGWGMEGAVARWYARNAANRQRQIATAAVAASQMAPGSSARSPPAPATWQLNWPDSAIG